MKKTHWFGTSVLCASGVIAALVACSGQRLPPGTPPPEYEPPIVPPWTPEQGGAGQPDPNEHASVLTNPPDAGVAPELSLDAGSR